MSKRIENVRELILVKSEELLFEAGYKGFNMREIAKRCGIAVGTIFNYYESREILIATIMAKDWRAYISEMSQKSNEAVDVQEGISAIYNGINSYSRKYETIWYGYPGNIIGYLGTYHARLRQKIADIIINLLSRFNIRLDDSVVSIYAEAVLASSVNKDLDLEDLLKFTTQLLSTGG